MGGPVTERSNVLWDRIAAGTGLLFVALVILAILVADFPALSQPPDAIAAFFQAEQDSVQLNAVLWAFGTVALLWFAGSVRAHMADAELGQNRVSTLAFGFAAVAVALILVTLSLSSGLAYTIADRADAGVTAAIFELRHMLQVFTTYALAGFVGAAGIAILRAVALPRWLGAAGLVAALLLVASGLAPLFQGSSLPPGKVFGNIAFYAFLAWVAVTSVLLIARLGMPERRA